MNKDLLVKYKEKDFKDIKKYGKAFSYYNSLNKFYTDLQDGIADENNFFDYTFTIFEEVNKPKGEPDYVSDSGSRYWYRKDGVIRGSNHWGNGVARCDWPYRYKNGKVVYGLNWKCLKQFKEEMYGFSKWKDFKFKADLINIDGEEVITCFNNVVGRDLIKYKGKTYQKVIVETYEKVK